MGIQESWDVDFTKVPDSNSIQSKRFTLKN